MPHVDVPIADLTLDRVVEWLRQELGEGYRVGVPHEAGHIKVEVSPLVYANVHLKGRADGTRLSVHGGGFLVDRLMNEWSIARTVTKALRTAPMLASERRRAT
jgi:hypothetical protein